MPDTQVTDNPSLHRFELKQGNETAFILYSKTSDSIRLVHTEVPPALQGQGIASKLVRGTLELLRNSGLKIVPSCPFVADYIKRHREYLHLIDPDQRRDFESES